MDLRRTLLARLTLAFAVLLLLFGLVWLKDLREDALAEQQATVHLIEFLLASPDDDAPARLAAALTPGQFRHVKLDMSAPEAMSPGTPAQPRDLLTWLGLSMEGAQAHRIRVGTQDLWISPDPDSEFREKLSTSVQVLIMLVLFCGICLGLTWFAVDHALSPVKELNAGLVRLAAGQERAQLPGFALREFAAIAQVVDQLADSLSRARESQRRLTRQLMEVQDKERRELAAELHDEFGQSLTAISATAAYIEHHAHHAEAATLTDCAREIGSESRRISGHVRQMLTQLRPYGLEDSGMREALRELVAAWQARLPDLQIKVHIGPLPAVSAEVGLALYRCLQEALTNCVRHSGAQHIEVTVGVLTPEHSTAPGDEPVRRIGLTVSDNGTGQAQVLQRQPGGGLLGLRERLAMVGGHLHISDRPGGGVVLSATLPVQDKETL
ncbi:sensor histidine kinase [Limnohabitans sp. WS1]|uniref:sensor histidine kinase n=1 Tax=Limnohabitans sp. WS1 TaxID=1100726 RepID=UPI001304E321|nr:histidine kinase [Limnohabitans sp. WS1]